MLKLVSPLVVIAGIVIASVAFYVQFTTSNTTSSNAGTFPTAVARPGLIGQTPVPPALRQKPDAAVAVMDATQVQAVIARMQQDGNVTPGSAHATLSTAGALPDLQNIGASVASDYPVWVVTLSGTFHQSFGGPVGFPSPTYTTATYYLDGYSGGELGLVLSGQQPAAAQATSTPIPLQAAPVIDAATATQDVIKLAGDLIQSGTASATLTTMGAVPTVPIDIATHFASAYPVWVVTADAAGLIDGRPGGVRRFYLDGYSGVILMSMNVPAASPTP